MVGDWMGSLYDIAGRRYDYHLFLDNDGQFERNVVCGATDYNKRDAGRWELREEIKVLRLESNAPDEFGATIGDWKVLAVKTCETSNVLLVLRAVMLASRNLPILLYRVHCYGRGYGTGWEERLAQQNDSIDTAKK